MKIGLLGAVLNNENLGCVALSYSLIKTIYELNPDVEIILYEPSVSGNSIELLKTEMSIKNLKISNRRLNYIGKNFVKKFLTQRNFRNELNSINVVFDITEGDSFTDIYGQKRFDGVIKMKKDVINAGIPLILVPQTYGPFQVEENKKIAMEIISKASAVITRDEISQKFVQSIIEKQVKLTTDLAFSLPYNKTAHFSRNRKAVGLNISGLLWGDFETGTQKNFEIKADYQKIIRNILQYLEQTEWQIHLISHVISPDMKAIQIVAKEFPNIIVASEFKSPVEAKNYISKMDLFIGSRMHATIASFSSGVATIPVSYSRKFSGLFNSLNYPHDISLNDIDTEEAINLIKDKIENVGILRKDLENSKEIVNQKIEYLNQILQPIICESQSD